jgi:hypothetical protein
MWRRKEISLFKRWPLICRLHKFSRAAVTLR